MLRPALLCSRRQPRARVCVGVDQELIRRLLSPWRRCAPWLIPGVTTPKTVDQPKPRLPAANGCHLITTTRLDPSELVLIKMRLIHPFLPITAAIVTSIRRWSSGSSRQRRRA